MQILNANEQYISTIQIINKNQQYQSTMSILRSCTAVDSGAESARRLVRGSPQCRRAPALAHAAAAAAADLLAH